MQQFETLNIYERLSEVINRVTAHNVVVVGKVNALFSRDVIETALHALTTYHPRLLAKIILHNNKLCFKYNHFDKVSLHYINNSDDWLGCVEQELNLRFDHNEPLFRVTVIEFAEITYFAFTIHHSITDALPFAYLLKDFLLLLDDMLLGQSGNVQPASDQPPFLDTLPETNAIDIPAIDIVEHKAIPVEHLTTKLRVKSLGAEQSSEFFKRCRQLNISVHEAISAIGLLTLNSWLGECEQSRAISCVSLVNLRQQLNLTIKKNQLSFFSASFITEHLIDNSSIASDLADDLQAKIKHSITNKTYLHEPKILAALLEQSDGTAEIMEQLDNPHPSVCISSLGVLDMPARFSSFKLEEFHEFVTTHAYARRANRFLLVPYTFDERLSLAFHFPSPPFNDVAVDEIMHLFAERIV